MNIYEKISGLIGFLTEKIKDAEFMEAFDCRGTSRNIDRPVVTVNGEYEETEEGQEGRLAVKMYVPTHCAITAAEVIFAKIWVQIKEYLPQLKSLSRKPVAAENGMAVISCSAVFYSESGCAFTINGGVYNSSRLSIYRDSEIFKINPVESGQVYSFEKTGGYVGEIYSCNLGDADALAVFTLEYGRYRYFNCRWQRLSYGMSDVVREAVFYSSGRQRI